MKWFSLINTFLLAFSLLVSCASTPKTGADVSTDFELRALAIYTMDDIEGNILKDKSGKGYNAQISQELPKTTEGKIGKALIFDGSETYIVLPKEVLEGQE